MTTNTPEDTPENTPDGTAGTSTDGSGRGCVPGGDVVDVVVVGGGIAGLAGAHALAQEGHTVRVLERRPVLTETLAETGAGLQLGPNGTGVLDRRGLLGEVTNHAVLPDRATLRDAVTGEVLTFLDLHHVRRRYGAPHVVLRRSTLHTILHQACTAAGVELVPGITVTDLHHHADTDTSAGAGACAVSEDEDGNRRCDRGRVVLGADGLWSRMRALISPDTVGDTANDTARDTGFRAYRGVVPVDAVLGTRAALDETVLFIGPDRHFVQYPLDGAETVNHVAVFRPRLRIEDILHGPAGDHRPFVGLGEPFALDCDHLREATQFLDPERDWKIYDRDPIPEWVDRRLVLVGDAAHPMLQYFAQGACQALEDADTLAKAARAYRTARNPGNWDNALRAYSRTRIPRATDMQLKVRTWGDYLHADTEQQARRNILLRDRDPADYQHLDWLYAA